MQVARLVGAAKHVAHPLGWIALEYRVAGANGRPKPGRHTLKLLMTSDEARGLAQHYALLAAEIDAMGGTMQ